MPKISKSNVINAASANNGTLKAMITDIQRSSFHDGPGLRTLVFLKGCPLRCHWCQNPECLNPWPELSVDQTKCIRCRQCIAACRFKAIKDHNDYPLTNRNTCETCGKCVDACTAQARTIIGKRMSVQEVFQIIKKDFLFYNHSGGGVTLTGGEPLMQWKFAAAFFKLCQKNGINTAIETSGYASWHILKTVLMHTNYLLYDLKAMDSSDHLKYTGKTNQLILTNLLKASRMKIPLFIRVPFLRGINHHQENLERLAKIAQKTGVKEIHLLPYHSFGVSKYRFLGIQYLLTENRNPTHKQLKAAKRLLQAKKLKVSIGGIA